MSEATLSEQVATLETALRDAEELRLKWQDRCWYWVAHHDTQKLKVGELEARLAAEAAQKQEYVRQVLEQQSTIAEQQSQIAELTQQLSHEKSRGVSARRGEQAWAERYAFQLQQQALGRSAVHLEGARLRREAIIGRPTKVAGERDHWTCVIVDREWNIVDEIALPREWPDLRRHVTPPPVGLIASPFDANAWDLTFDTEDCPQVYRNPAAKYAVYMRPT